MVGGWRVVEGLIPRDIPELFLEQAVDPVDGVVSAGAEDVEVTGQHQVLVLIAGEALSLEVHYEGVGCEEISIKDGLLNLGHLGPRCTSSRRTVGRSSWCCSSQSWLHQHLPGGAWKGRGYRRRGRISGRRWLKLCVDQQWAERELVGEPQQASGCPIRGLVWVPGVERSRRRGGWYPGRSWWGTGAAPLGQNYSAREGSELVHGEVLLVHQLCSGDGRHPGEELVPRAVAATVLHGLQVVDRGELEGALVSESWESMELLAPMVVGEVGLPLDQYLEDSVRLVLRSQGPRDAVDDLEQQVRNHYCILVLFSHHTFTMKVASSWKKHRSFRLCTRATGFSGLVLLRRLSSCPGNGGRGLLSYGLYLIHIYWVQSPRGRCLTETAVIPWGEEGWRKSGGAGWRQVFTLFHCGVYTFTVHCGW